jgi:hypothetical protein
MKKNDTTKSSINPFKLQISTTVRIKILATALCISGTLLGGTGDNITLGGKGLIKRNNE